MGGEQQRNAQAPRRSASAITAEVLDPRSGDGWWVLHELCVPGADHVVITPGAVWVVASSPAPTTSVAEIDALGIGVAMVERQLATSPVGVMVPVRGVRCGTDVSMAATPWPAGGVDVVGVAGLARLLASVPGQFTPGETEHLARVVDEGFANRRGRVTSLVRPAPQPPASAELPVLHPSGRVVRGVATVEEALGEVADGVAGVAPAHDVAAVAGGRGGGWSVLLRRLTTAALVGAAAACAVAGIAQLAR